MQDKTHYLPGGEWREGGGRRRGRSAWLEETFRWVVVRKGAGIINLNGHTLTVDIASGRSPYMFDTGSLCGSFTNGAVEVVSGGWLKFGARDGFTGTVRDMRTVDFTINCALNRWVYP